MTSEKSFVGLHIFFYSIIMIIITHKYAYLKSKRAKTFINTNFKTPGLKTKKIFTNQTLGL